MPSLLQFSSFPDSFESILIKPKNKNVQNVLYDREPYNKPPESSKRRYKSRCKPQKRPKTLTPKTTQMVPDDYDQYKPLTEADMDTVETFTNSAPLATGDDNFYEYQCGYFTNHIRECEKCQHDLGLFNHVEDTESYSESPTSGASMTPLEIIGEFQNIFTIFFMGVILLLILDIFFRIRKMKI